jgi:4'-phosphopantetheinyl transferase
MTDRFVEAIPARLSAPGPGTLQVWWATTDVDAHTLTRAAEALDPATLDRAGRMRREADRRRTLLAHALLRRLLAATTGTPASELAIQRRCASCGATDHGRPFLPGAPSFGLSHGGDAVAVALGASDASVAVDVEEVQPAERWEAVRRHAFSDAEWTETASDPAGERTQLWTRKEAAVKATGHGLSLALTRVHFAPTPHATDATFAVRFDRGDPHAPEGAWAAADLQLAPEHRTAIAWRGTATPLTISTHRAAL